MSKYTVLVKINEAIFVQEVKCDRFFLQDGCATFCNVVPPEDDCELSSYGTIKAYAAGRWLEVVKDE